MTMFYVGGGGYERDRFLADRKKWEKKASPPESKKEWGGDGAVWEKKKEGGMTRMLLNRRKTGTFPVGGEKMGHRVRCNSGGGGPHTDEHSTA